MPKKNLAEPDIDRIRRDTGRPVDAAAEAALRAAWTVFVPQINALADLFLETGRTEARTAVLVFINLRVRSLGERAEFLKSEGRVLEALALAPVAEAFSEVFEFLEKQSLGGNNAAS